MITRTLLLQIDSLERDGRELLRLPLEEARRLLPEWRERHGMLFNLPDLREDLNDRLIEIETQVSERLP